MEPGLGGQEKSHGSVAAQNPTPVAMEPGLGGQEKLQLDLDNYRIPVSQWSLALAARKSAAKL